MSRHRTGRLKLLLFDIDGTLLLSGGAGLRALNQAFLELLGTANAFDGIPVAGRTDPLLLNDATARIGVLLDKTQRRRFHDRYCDLLEHEILQPGPRKGLMPGVEELLNHVHHQPELCVGLLTGNFARAARIKLEYFGLWPFFVCGAYGDDAAQRDELVPVAVARARTAGAIVCSPAQVVVIGDTPLDIRCATAAGARSIAVATGLFDVQTLERKGATAVLPDLTDWKAFLAILDEF